MGGASRAGPVNFLTLLAVALIAYLGVRRMTKIVDDIVAEIANIAAAVNALEAVVTDLKSKIADPDDAAKLVQALADLKSAVADAGDGVDEAAP